MSLAWLNKSKKKCNTMKSLKHATFSKSPACEQTHKWTGLKALFRPVATKSALNDGFTLTSFKQRRRCKPCKDAAHSGGGQGSCPGTP